MGRRTNRSAAWSKIGSCKRRTLRRRLIERDGTKCFHCGRWTHEHEHVDGLPGLPDQMTVDHYPVPKAKLPKTEWLRLDRVVIACLECNQGRNTEEQTTK